MIHHQQLENLLLLLNPQRQNQNQHQTQQKKSQPPLHLKMPKLLENHHLPKNHLLKPKKTHLLNQPKELRQAKQNLNPKNQILLNLVRLINHPKKQNKMFSFQFKISMKNYGCGQQRQIKGKMRRISLK